MGPLRARLLHRLQHQHRLHDLKSRLHLPPLPPLPRPTSSALQTWRSIWLGQTLVQRSGFLGLRQMQTGSLEFERSLHQQRPSNTGRYVLLSSRPSFDCWIPTGARDCWDWIHCSHFVSWTGSCVQGPCWGVESDQVVCHIWFWWHPAFHSEWNGFIYREISWWFSGERHTASTGDWMPPLKNSLPRAWRGKTQTPFCLNGMKNPYTRSDFHWSKCQPQNQFSIVSCYVLQVARPVSWTEPQFTDNVKIEHVMARLESRITQTRNGNIPCLIEEEWNYQYCLQRPARLRHGFGKALGDLPGCWRGQEQGEVCLHHHCRPVQARAPRQKVCLVFKLDCRKNLSRVFLCLSTQDISVSTGGCCVGWATQAGRLGCWCQR